jgi:hypothetical protein
MISSATRMLVGVSSSGGACRRRFGAAVQAAQVAIARDLPGDQQRRAE